jgi:hypothetical protein
MFALAIPTISTWLSQGSVANQVNGTSSSNLTGTSAAQNGPTSTSGVQNAFDNLISQIQAAAQTGTQPNAANTPATASSVTNQAVHGHHGHGHGGGGAGLSTLLQQLEQLAANNPSTGSSSALTSAGSATGAASTGAASALSSTSTANLEATLNQLLQNLKLAGSSTNVGALSSAPTAQGSLSLAQRLAQQRVAARAGNLLRAVA